MRIFICCILMLLTACPIRGQVVEVERGKVEFVGLEQWTVPALVDTLRALEPDRPLHACAAVLKQRLGFSDASVMSYPDENGMYTVVTVIEPQDSVRVRYQPTPSDTMRAIPVWQEALSLFKGGFGAFHMGLQFYGSFLTGHPDSARAQISDLADYADPEKVETLWGFLQSHNREEDKELALWTLTRDGNEKNRVVAVAILANFPGSDLVWWRLVDALRDSSASVRSMAQAVLSTFWQHVPRPVDWEPAVGSLEWIIGGTNLFAFPSTLELLRRTGISPDLANELLKGNAALLLAYLQAEHDKTRQTARDFFVHLSGHKYDRFQQWEQWLEQLTEKE